ncbi:MAG TPA: hypothetical protein VFO07_06515 [Roseiflexaceae bacterium]|nr:hypothetical protein [Roseiflexaceae bacterium]
MDLAAFRASVEASTPVDHLSHALQALWHDAKGDWRTAHEHAQAQDDRDGAWVHAYLHRKEGDLANAGYWYRRAGRPVAGESLDAEWETIAAALLG